MEKKSVLIVDDDVDASRMTKMILEETGLYSVSICNRGSEALKIIKAIRPDLALLDIVMPDADGAEIAAQIREDRSLIATRIVFMTSLVSQKEASESSMIGGHPFISKPVSAEILLKKIEGFLKLEH